MKVESFVQKIKTEDFQAYGNEVIDHLKDFAKTQNDWQVVPNNYEGVRISCTSPTEDGWLLLRLSLHDPVIPLNVESNVERGVSAIAMRLHDFMQEFNNLDLSPLSSFL